MNAEEKVYYPGVSPFNAGMDTALLDDPRPCPYTDPVAIDEWVAGWAFGLVRTAVVKLSTEH